jgi:hypothetical protein
MISEGYYSAKPTAHKWGFTSTGTRQVAIQFQLLDGPNRGESIIWYGFFTDDTWERTCESLRFCGWKGDDLSSLGELNQVVSLTIQHQEYNGKMSARVAWVNSGESGAIRIKKEMTNDELSKFAAMMKARAGRVKEVSGRVAPAEVAPAASAVPADSLNDPGNTNQGSFANDDPGFAVDDLPF